MTPALVPAAPSNFSFSVPRSSAAPGNVQSTSSMVSQLYYTPPLTFGGVSGSRSHTPTLSLQSLPSVAIQRNARNGRPFVFNEVLYQEKWHALEAGELSKNQLNQLLKPYLEIMCTVKGIPFVKGDKKDVLIEKLLLWAGIFLVTWDYTLMVSILDEGYRKRTTPTTACPWQVHHGRSSKGHSTVHSAAWAACSTT